MFKEDLELFEKGCRWFCDKENMNPNNFDIYFDVNSIPANIKKDKISHLENRLQRLMPLSKKIHLNIENGVKSFNKSNGFIVYSKIKFNKSEEHQEYLRFKKEYKNKR